MNRLYLVLVMTMVLLSACTRPSEVILGGDRDQYGCIHSAGYSWSVIKQECVRPWEVADIKIDDPTNKTLAIYVILSPDKSKAELFASNIPSNTLLDVVKGGYVSQDGKIHLQNKSTGWHLIIAN